MTPLQPAQVQILFQTLVTHPEQIATLIVQAHDYVSLLMYMNPARTVSQSDIILSEYLHQHPAHKAYLANHPALHYLIQLYFRLDIDSDQLENYMELAIEVLIELNAVQPEQFNPTTFIINFMAGMIRHDIIHEPSPGSDHTVLTFQRVIPIIIQLLPTLGLSEDNIEGGEEYYGVALLYLLHSHSDILQLIFAPSPDDTEAVSTETMLTALDCMASGYAIDQSIQHFLLLLIQNPAFIPVVMNIINHQPSMLFNLVTNLDSITQHSAYCQSTVDFIIPGLFKHLADSSRNHHDQSFFDAIYNEYPKRERYFPGTNFTNYSLYSVAEPGAD